MSEERGERDFACASALVSGLRSPALGRWLGLMWEEVFCPRISGNIAVHCRGCLMHAAPLTDVLPDVR
jgi:hypothetical protein